MRLGFIGAGNMGSAIIKGLLNEGSIPANNIYISRKRPALSAEFASVGVHVTGSNKDLVKGCDCVVLAVKPIYTASVIEEVYEQLVGKCVISIVAGWSYDMLKAALPTSARFIRVMPNTPLAAGEGMTLISDKYTCSEEEFAYTKKIFSAAGKVAVMEDHIFTAANGISGCGPAFVFEFIEAMADGGVRCGVPRALAYELAAQTMLGAAKMVLDTGTHPAELKDQVCSPGGTTIEGIYALEKGGMRAAVMDAVSASVEKTIRMSK